MQLKSRFRVKNFADLPLEQNFYIIKGLVKNSEPRSEFRGRVIAKNKNDAKKIILHVLREEFGVKNVYDIEISKLTPEKTKIEIRKILPLYLRDKATSLIREFYQGIYY